jgi:hypothetical protein
LQSKFYVFFLISEEEIVTSELKGKASAGFDENPDLLVKECIKCIKYSLILFLMNP